MRISVTIFVILISTYIVNASVLDPVIENVVHLKASKPPSGVPGIWKKKTIWKPRWVKEWKSAKVMKPVWRKVWSPVQIREWVPIPKPPPGWDSISTPLAPVHPRPQKAHVKSAQKAPLKDSLGHDSFKFHSSTKVPLWDPVPYPESQQPPPSPFPQSIYSTDFACGKGGCDNSPSQTFSHSQISEIIGAHMPDAQTPEYYQSPEYSETVNHLTRIPPDRNNWRPPQPHQNFQSNNRFNNFQGLLEFLEPPKLQYIPENNFLLQSINKIHPPTENNPGSHFPKLQIQNGLRQWNPLPPENKIKGHFITKAPNQPHKFLIPDSELSIKNNTAHPQNLNMNAGDKSNIQIQKPGSEIRPPIDGDFIQEAQLVGEYHYSEFDLPDLNKPQPALKEKEEIGAKPHQKLKIVEQESVQKPKPNEQIVVENKQKQTITGIIHALKQSEIRPPENEQKQTITRISQSEVHNIQDSSRVQKKHITNSIPNLSNFNHNSQPQEAVIKQVFPVYKTFQNLSPSSLTNQKLTFTLTKNQEKVLPPSDQSTGVTPLSTNNTAVNFNIQRQKEIYPVFEIPKSVNPIPPNHRFPQPSEVKTRQNPLSPNNSTRLQQTPTVKYEKAWNDNTNNVQLVFATTPDDYNHSTEDLQKTTTTEQYDIIFSSSLSTTETVTKSPIIIVTPANSTTY